MRVLGVDLGERRIGLALSDATGLLARPWQTLPAGDGPEASARKVGALLTDGDDDVREVMAIVVGLPRRLNGEDTHLTPAVRSFATHLHACTGLDVRLQDERLSSYEADALLAKREPNWRTRKKQVDAMAAAIILQDYLDEQAPTRRPAGAGDP